LQYNWGGGVEPRIYASCDVGTDLKGQSHENLVSFLWFLVSLDRTAGSDLFFNLIKFSHFNFF
jgi:hypothetical protein